MSTSPQARKLVPLRKCSSTESPMSSRSLKQRAAKAFKSSTGKSTRCASAGANEATVATTEAFSTTSNSSSPAMSQWSRRAQAHRGRRRLEPNRAKPSSPQPPAQGSLDCRRRCSRCNRSVLRAACRGSHVREYKPWVLVSDLAESHAARRPGAEGSDGVSISAQGRLLENLHRQRPSGARRRPS